nr:L-tyrosine/L-tryptophan isonitrile synthase family protein [Kibdelosporangium sp. MJ126-NF4]CEL20724.1 PvcA protein, related to known isonitrile synthases [Kibdelosporangium sp. MJ126-NF4]CTQ89637.1 PvcA protein, related to known isonitrile synthases [Kibdelosporangium sp. MJ126-NF4]
MTTAIRSVAQSGNTISVATSSESIIFDPHSVLYAPPGGNSPLFPAAHERSLLEYHPGLDCQIDYQEMAAQATANAKALVGKMWSQLKEIDDPARRIFELMRSGRYRAGSPKTTDFSGNWPLWRSRLNHSVRTQTPISIIILSFPCKIPNPLKVRRRAPDMAELLSLTQLFEITEVLRLVHPPGAVLHLLSDGNIYGPLSGISRAEVRRYHQELARMIRLLGAESVLRQVDLVDDVIAAHNEEYHTVRRLLEPELRRWWSNNIDDPRRRYFLRNFAWNVQLTDETAVLLASGIHAALADELPTDALETLDSVRGGIKHKVEEAAFNYLLMRSTLHISEVIDKYDSCNIRATAVPKAGQWSINMVNRHTSMRPWHGVAVRKASGSWRLRYEIDALRQGYVPVYSTNDPTPFYYQAVRQ